MRQTNETAKSFIQLKEITQIMQAQKPSAQNSTNTKLGEITSQSTLKPKESAQSLKGALKPTKKAFSERQITTIRDNSQASANKSFETKESNHANAFKSDEANKRGEQ